MTKFKGAFTQISSYHSGLVSITTEEERTFIITIFSWLVYVHIKRSGQIITQPFTRLGKITTLTLRELKFFTFQENKFIAPGKQFRVLHLYIPLLQLVPVLRFYSFEESVCLRSQKINIDVYIFLEIFCKARTLPKRYYSVF